jgi:YYY domain-containing protein
MLPSDIYAVLQWWSILLLMGVGFAPLTFYLFDKFFDKGYIFSKLIGLIITGYAVFLLGVLKILPFNTIAIFIVFFAAVIISILALPQKWKILYVLKRFWPIFLIEELMFLIVLFVWSYVHSFAPDIHGLEKYMDFGFINSFLRSEYLPAKDMWFTPFTINYYYFGHLLTAMLTKMSALSSALTFNLMLSTIVAFCFVETFSIGANLYIQLAQSPRISKFKTALSGLLSAALVTFTGNLHILYAFFKPYKTETPVPFWQLQFNPLEFPNSYWYPNATRFIYNTIHEFPIYSWVVADLHGHVLDIPFVLLIIGLSLALIFTHTQRNPDEEQKLKTFMINPFVLVFFGLLLACMYMTNAWDGAIYLLLIGLVLFYVHSLATPLYKKAFEKEDKDAVVVIKKSDANKKSMPKISDWQFAFGRDYMLSLLIVLSSFFLFATPYNLNFDPFVSGIGVLCAPEFLTNIGKIGPFLFEADHCQRSYPWQLFTLYGFFYFFVTIFAVAMIRAKNYNPTDIFVLLLIMLSTFLIIIPEFFYVKDIYPAHYRANTMFKLVFQAFIMLGISSAYIIVRTFTLMQLSNFNLLRKFLALLFAIFVVFLVWLVMTYPYLAVKAYYGDFKLYKGLNGITYLQTLYPADYEAIAWLNENVKGQPVILESQGDSYTDYGRVSTNTGLPTVLGWTVHEWLWRGSYDIPSPRITEIKDLYETSDIEKTKALIKKHNIKYVFIGNLEYQKHPTLDENKFKELGEVVFQKDNTKIYKIK